MVSAGAEGTGVGRIVTEWPFVVGANIVRDVGGAAVNGGSSVEGTGL